MPHCSKSPASKQYSSRTETRSGGLGLSTLHKCSRARTWARIEAVDGQEDRYPRVQVPVGGNLVELKAGRRVGVAPPGGPRGRVVEFSAAARRRLQRRLASINREVAGLPLFVTLTYPLEWSEDGRRWKRDLKAWWGRVRRRWPAASAVWRLEFQKRGAPHYHLLVFGVPSLPVAWVSRSWYQVVGSGDPKHLAAGTQVARVKSWRGVAAYASKYMAKIGGGSVLADVGRYWGVLGGENLPVVVVEVVLSFAQFFKLRRVLRRYLAGRGVRLPDKSEWQGRTCFMSWDVGARLLAGLAR